ncbi:MAG TPA: chorismate mutase [Candidatus Saccharimonadales bacterium]|jgi:chorismate mutase
MNKEIAELRGRIDDIDNRVLRLMGQRLELATEVGHIKGNWHRDAARENAIIKRLQNQNQNEKLRDQAVSHIWNCIFEHSRQAQASSLDTIKS